MMYRMTEDLYRLWGQNIRKLRQAKDKREGRKASTGMAVMAYALGVAPETVSRWETGKLVPRDGRKIEIGEYLEVTPRIIFPLVRIPK